MKQLAMLAVLLGLAGMLTLADDAKDNKVPLDYIVRIQSVQLDAQSLQTQLIQLQVQYQADQATLAHDQQEITQIEQEALKATGHDSTKFTIDLKNKEFVAVPEAKAPAAK